MENLFDLNIEKVLEHWEPEHAVREIIANALDEQILTNTESIEIFREESKWHIRDYGRGLKYNHFTQNENKEKLDSPFLIGKFGVGLKDALAVFYRKEVTVEIDSKYSNVTLIKTTKSSFDIKTLHASFKQSKDPNMQGTDFILDGIREEAILKAKSMFLCFNNAILLEKTRYGEVYRCENVIPSIYINGVQVATEENFMFSYNITSINTQIKKALNRERSNVGRTAYSDTIKNILRQCKSDEVLLTLVEDLENVMKGCNKDESGWVDVATYAAKTLDAKGSVVFMTPTQRASLTNQQVEVLEQSGKKLVMITDNVYSKIAGSVTTYDEVYREYENSYTYNFVDYNKLTSQEKQVFDLSSFVIKFLESHKYKNNVQIKISETIKVDILGGITYGVWDSKQNAIIIKRSVLKSKPHFLGVLIHEFAHFHSGFYDNTREFENILTDILGFALFDNTISRNVTHKKNLVSKLLGK